MTHGKDTDSRIVNIPKTFVSHNPYYVGQSTFYLYRTALLVLGLSTDHCWYSAQRQADQTVSLARDLVSTRRDRDHGIESGSISASASASARSSASRQALQARPGAAETADLWVRDAQSCQCDRLPYHEYTAADVSLQTMPEQIPSSTFIDTEPDDETDSRILQPAISKATFDPSPPSRFERLQLMPPPTETSVSASKTLGKEFKSLVTLQEENKLPFYISPDTDR